MRGHSRLHTLVKKAPVAVISIFLTASTLELVRKPSAIVAAQLSSFTGVKRKQR